MEYEVVYGRGVTLEEALVELHRNMRKTWAHYWLLSKLGGLSVTTDDQAPDGKRYLIMQACTFQVEAED